MINLTVFGVYAQDIIVKNDKTEIKAKNRRADRNNNKIRKKQKCLMGHLIDINKRDVFMIIYKNGTKEYVDQKKSNINSKPSRGKKNLNQLLI